MTNNKEILFGGGGQFPPDIAKFEKSEEYSPIDSAICQLASTDEGKILYGDPQKGTTLEQAWRLRKALYGTKNVCLLSQGKPETPIEAIEHVVEMDSQSLVAALAELLELSDDARAIVLYHDGYRGHAISIVQYNKTTSRFAYIDSWPGDSLLTKKLNAAGIDAQKEDDISLELPNIGRAYWTLTSEELKKVIFASFVDPALWSEYKGENYRLPFKEFKNSDFWKFFRLKEYSRQKTLDNKTIIILEPGNFQSKIHLQVLINNEMELIQGLLALDRSWIFNPLFRFTPEALGITRSFISALIPSLDQQEIIELTSALHKLQFPNRGSQSAAKLPEKYSIHGAVLTYLGLSESFFDSFNFSNISMTNIRHHKPEIFQIDVMIKHYDRHET